MIATQLFPASQFSTIEDCRRANEYAGQHFFDAATLRFFRSRVGSNVYRTPDGGALFVTSEQFRGSRGYTAARRYTIRRILRNGHVVDVSDFQEYASGTGANRIAAALAATMEAGMVPVSCATCERGIDAEEWRAVAKRDLFFCHDCNAKRG